MPRDERSRPTQSTDEWTSIPDPESASVAARPDPVLAAERHLLDALDALKTGKTSEAQTRTRRALDTIIEMRTNEIEARSQLRDAIEALTKELNHDPGLAEQNLAAVEVEDWSVGGLRLADVPAAILRETTGLHTPLRITIEPQESDQSNYYRSDFSVL